MGRNEEEEEEAEQNSKRLWKVVKLCARLKGEHFTKGFSVSTTDRSIST